MSKLGTFLTRLAGAHCCEDTAQIGISDQCLLLVGNPNVGKSALFNALTGQYVTVSNYPGTTVEISRGHCRRLPGYTVIDTPGMYSLLPITDEERVARSVLLRQKASAVVHVVDAKSLPRMLGLTLQMIEAGLPVVLALNMWDEAQAAGVHIDCQKLEEILGVPVVPTVATSGKGLATLVERIKSLRPSSAAKIEYGPVLEDAIVAIEPSLAQSDGVSRRARAILLLHGDHEQTEALTAADPAAAESVAKLCWDTLAKLGHTTHFHTSMAVRARVDQILSQAAQMPPLRASGLRHRLSDLCMNPWTGFPLLALVLYFGLYQFVGVFGAGTCVDLLQNTLFGDRICPWFTDLADKYIPWPVLRELFVGEYGIITLGIRYAVAIVFPIVGTFFIAFSVIEDSGYLPRLAMLIDRIFKRIGLSGRAVIPMVLGFGCDTMATMVTRTLETKRERVIATFLLALAIPCSAQLGLIMALLAGHPAGLAVWAGVMILVFLGAGMLASRFLPGERPSFYMELPPLRLPRIGNVLVKTYTRMVWYFKEVLPLFIIASVAIWIGRLDFLGLLPEGGVFGLIVNGLKPAVSAIGLPDESAVAFLFGFFRRDYGAAGLFDLHTAGKIAGNQLVVAAVTLTLFLPCIAQFLIMKKERGLKMTLLVSAFITVFAFAMGFVLNVILNATGAKL